jgi:hypothetical protein
MKARRPPRRSLTVGHGAGARGAHPCGPHRRPHRPVSVHGPRPHTEPRRRPEALTSLSTRLTGECHTCGPRARARCQQPSEVPAFSYRHRFADLPEAAGARSQPPRRPNRRTLGGSGVGCRSPRCVRIPAAAHDMQTSGPRRFTPDRPCIDRGVGRVYRRGAPRAPRGLGAPRELDVPGAERHHAQGCLAGLVHAPARQPATPRRARGAERGCLSAAAARGHASRRRPRRRR